MTMVVDGTTTSVEQVRKQLDKLIDVIRVTDISGPDIIARELALIKVKANSKTRSEIIQIVDIYKAKIVDVTSDTLTVEITSDEDKVNSLYELLKAFGVKEFARTGRVALGRG
jgi:acetolactate synthase-1/3 small subunit